MLRASAAIFAKHARLKSLLLCTSRRETPAIGVAALKKRIGKVNRWQIQAPARSRRMTSTRASARMKF
ncbi:hypothetical protein AGR7C_Cc70022 [Agrobacterium deltaense Zutra 3/1]|uniref:Uncharacterized protein n=1 Tax=Agrobacterium deltaense Zutra 3/1 TaxID=1183427 RepID=A0A1S7QKE5_9HYPH|nr:hypothetical protein AGR7C_Cc70022 [Agrobacterium deltaense Zutra 3/1]